MVDSCRTITQSTHLVGEEHGETVDAQPPAAGRGKTVLHSCTEVLIVNLEKRERERDREATWRGKTKKERKWDTINAL